MNWIEETARSISAALQLLLHDRDGLEKLNNTSTGFWFSFSAILFIAPVYLFIASIDWAVDGSPPAKSFSAVSSLISLVVQWSVWPVVMIFVTRWLGLGQQFTRYVIVYNWSNVVLIVLIAFPATLFGIGLVSLTTATIFTGFLQMVTIYLEWYLARASLDTNGLIAGAVVLANFVLSIGVLRLIG